MFSRSVPNRQQSQGTSMVKKVLFIASVLIAVVCYIMIMNGQAQTHSVSGELMIGQSEVQVAKESTITQTLLKYFGSFTYVFPLLFVYIGYTFFIKNFTLKDIDLFKLSIKILGFNLSIIGFCSLFSIMFSLQETGGGGILGDYINIIFKGILGSTLFPILSILASLIGSCLLMSLNPLFVTDLLGQKVTRTFNKKEESKDTSFVKTHEEPIISPVSEDDIKSLKHKEEKESEVNNTSFNNNPLFDENDVVANKDNNNYTNQEDINTSNAQNLYDNFNNENYVQNEQFNENYNNNNDAYINNNVYTNNDVYAENNTSFENYVENPNINQNINNEVNPNNIYQAEDNIYTDNKVYTHENDYEEAPTTFIKSNENVFTNRDDIDSNNAYYNEQNALQENISENVNNDFASNFESNSSINDTSTPIREEKVVYETRSDLKEVEIDPNDTRQSTFIVDRQALLEKQKKIKEEKERQERLRLEQERLEREQQEALLKAQLEEQKQKEEEEKARLLEESQDEEDGVVHTFIKENSPFAPKQEVNNVEHDLLTAVQNEQAKALDAAINNTKEKNEDSSSIDLSKSNSSILNNVEKEGALFSKDLDTTSNTSTNEKQNIEPVVDKNKENQNLTTETRTASIAMPSFATETKKDAPLVGIPSAAENNIFTQRLVENNDEGEVIDFEFEKEPIGEPIEINGDLTDSFVSMETKNPINPQVEEEIVRPLISEKDAKYSYTNASRGVFTEGQELVNNNLNSSNNTLFSQNTNTQENINKYNTNANIVTNEETSKVDVDNTKANVSHLTNTSFKEDNTNYLLGEATPYQSKENRDFYDDRDNRDNLNVNSQNSQTSNYPSYMSDPNVGGNLSQGPLSTTIKRTQGYIGSKTTPKKQYDDWRPSIELLTPGPGRIDTNKEELDAMASKIDTALRTFNVRAKVAQYLTGPVITRYDLLLEPGVRSSTITNLSVDICRMLMVPNVHVLEFIPGTPYVGIEIPNTQRQMITFYDVASKDEFINSKALLPICLGCSVTGKPVVADLAAAPHLIVAGTTGSGKSVGLNTILISLLLKKSPSELRLLLIDPKRIEFSLYDNLPHLITPIITDVAEKSAAALNWCVDEMERRYNLLDRLGVRKYEEYNNVIKEANARGEKVMDPQWDPYSGVEQEELRPLPLLVIVVEEYADLILQTTGGGRKKSDNSPETAINRLAAKARAAGMHLILATQSPRADVVTSVIKTNMPSRMAFTVQSGIDSRIILDEAGAEKLLGKGDMLMKFTGVNQGAALRTHGAFLPNEDISRIVDSWIEKGGSPEYIDGVDETVAEELSLDGSLDSSPKLDEKFDQAAKFAREYYAQKQKYPPISDFQTMLGVGYPRAKKLVQQLTREGVITD